MSKSGLPQNAWVLIADGEKALFLINKGDKDDMNLNVLRKDEQENPKAGEWAANRPGRMHDTGVQQRSALENTDWHQIEKERFADDMADHLYKQAHKGAFDKLVIVASRPVLAELRRALHKEVESRIIHEVPKVLTNHPLDEIEDLLSKSLQEKAA